MQPPPQQLCPPEQVRPQAPQWSTSRVRSRQPSLQQAVPAAQADPDPHRHVPATQLSPTPQAGEQGTSEVQVPLMQVCPPVQRIPQPPQLAVSPCTSWQLPPQQAWPVRHGGPAAHPQLPSMQVSPSRHAGAHEGATHTPATHSSPGSQAMPQAPQSIGERRRFAQRMPQQVSPSAHSGAEPHVQPPEKHWVPRGAQR